MPYTPDRQPTRQENLPLMYAEARMRILAVIEMALAGLVQAQGPEIAVVDNREPVAEATPEKQNMATIIPIGPEAERLAAARAAIGEVAVTNPLLDRVPA